MRYTQQTIAFQKLSGAASSLDDSVTQCQLFAQALAQQPWATFIPKSIDVCKGWKHWEHSDFLGVSVTLTSSEPQYIVIYCAGLGNSPPPTSWFDNAIVFVVRGKSAYGLTGMRPDEVHTKTPGFVTESGLFCSHSG